MRKVVFFFLVAFVFFACGNKQANDTVDSKNFQLDNFLTQADQLVNDTVTVEGYVTHTCKHSGKRCFIVGEDENTTLRVEAGGEIKGFDRDLTGKKIAVKGVVMERRLTKEYIDQYEEKVKAKEMKEDGSAESCQKEYQNIAKMREWMKENNKDYYAIYYVDGQSYEVKEATK